MSKEFRLDARFKIEFVAWPECLPLRICTQCLEEQNCRIVAVGGIVPVESADRSLSTTGGA